MCIAGTELSQTVTRTSGDTARDGRCRHAAVARLLAAIKIAPRQHVYRKKQHKALANNT